MGDALIGQFIHRERLRPYRLFATSAASFYIQDDPLGINYYPRQRCQWCDMYDLNCRLYDFREGAQPARVLLHNHRSTPARPPALFTGTADKFMRSDQCTNPATHIGFGPCRAKDSQSQIMMGHLSLTKAVVTGRHHDHIPIDSDPSAVWARDDQAYATLGLPATHDYGYCGLRDPSGTPPQDHYDWCLRFPIDLPVDAIMLNVRLLLYRFFAQTGSCFVKALLLDRDDMGEFVDGTGTEADNPRRSNGSGPARLNVVGEGLNGFEIEPGAVNSYIVIPDDIIRPMIQAFIDRPGYVPGAYMGIVLESDRDSNITVSNSVPLIGYRSGEDMLPALLASWREAESEEHPKASQPPRLRAYRHYSLTPSPVPAQGTWPEICTGIDAGTVMPAHGGWAEPDVVTGLSGGAAGKIPDVPWASSYRHFFLLPVDPLLAWWNEEDYGAAPYPSDAHQHFALEDCETYEIPCYSRTLPFRYRSLGDSTFPKVKGGIPGIVGFSSPPAQQGYLPVYALSTGDCVVGGYAYAGVEENTWRVYSGQTRPKTHVWEADPLRRGWSVTYTAFLKAWFVLDSNFTDICWPQDVQPPGTPAGCMFRWNVWYEIDVRARFGGGADVDDAAFRSWVNTHAAGFGATVTPRYSHCNDVFRHCAGVAHGMGDAIWPPEACQNTAEASGGGGEGECAATVYAECHHQGDGYSYWYLPDWTSNHIKSPLAGPRIGAYPEYGLYHETACIRKRNAAGSETDTTYTWSRLGLTTNIPWILAVESEHEVQQAIHRIAIVNSNECESPCSAGEFRVGWDDDEVFWSAGIGPAATAAQVQTAIEESANIWPGDIAVSGPDGGPWDVEYVGWSGIDFPPPTLRACTLEDAYGCAYSVEITIIQHGEGG